MVFAAPGLSAGHPRDGKHTDNHGCQGDNGAREQQLIRDTSNNLFRGRLRRRTRPACASRSGLIILIIVKLLVATQGLAALTDDR